MMEKWVLSIVGIVSLSVLLDIILPEGKTNKYIKGVFAIMTICIMIAPLPDIVSSIKNGDIKSHFEYGKIDVDDAFLEDFNNEKMDVIENNLEKLLLNSGATLVSVDIVNTDNDDIIERIDVQIQGIKGDRAKQIILNALNIEVKEVIVDDGG